ncbi:MAG: GNAT family N-acetyltransferase [Abditibacteriales bacterium]|nr:GNAT family N-acetyltransferase [Abditibacteriales bacterium]MDW8367976.1 GNAT family N-acetyltransferase [Abditibacteriales bacterium]
MEVRREPLRVRLITEAEEFEALQAVWDATLQRCGMDSVFLTHAWLSTYWEHFGQHRTLRIFVAERAGQPVAFAPLMLSRSRATRLRRMELLGAGIHDYSDFIVPQDRPGAALHALWEAISDHADTWDVVRLAQVAADSPVAAYIAADEGFRVVATDGETCPTLTLPPTWRDYLSLVGKNTRSNLSRYPKRLAASFDVEYHLVTAPDTLDRTLTALFDLHARRWRQRGLPGVLFSPRRQAFHRALCRRLLARNRLRLFALRLDGREVAVLLNYFYAGKYFFFIGGFDPTYARWSVGTVLFGHAIRYAIEEGAREFDFLRGEEEYKYRLGAHDRPYRTLKVVKPHWRSRSLLHIMKFEEFVQARAKAWAARLSA